MGHDKVFAGYRHVHYLNRDNSFTGIHVKTYQIISCAVYCILIKSR